MTLHPKCPKCPKCQSMERFEILWYEILEEPKLNPEKWDMAFTAMQCKTCDHKFYPLSYINKILECHLYMDDGRSYSEVLDREIESWWLPPKSEQRK